VFRVETRDEDCVTVGDEYDVSRARWDLYAHPSTIGSASHVDAFTLATWYAERDDR